MNLRFYDRISDETVEQPPRSPLLGRYFLQPPEGDTQVHLNGQPAFAGQPLVPDLTDHWTVATRGGESIRKPVADKPLPVGLEIEAILAMQAKLTDPQMAESGWLGWISASPLAPGVRDAISVHKLARLIKEELPHLEQVCRKPTTHIRVDSERLNLGQARRLDRRAPEYLAAHTEDWQKLRLNGVFPRRIMALVREEEWNLYENRVAVRLVDRLVSWLRERLDEVNRIINEIYKRLSGELMEGTHQRRVRICTLFADAVKTEEDHAEAEKTRQVLEDLLHRLLGLMGSPLYKMVSRRAEVSGSLRQTNLLTNDVHYRGVARLWNHWLTYGAPRTLAPAILFRRNTELVEGWDAWCMLALIRACSQLELEPHDDDLETPIHPGVSLRLSSGHVLRWEHHGAISLVDPGGRPAVRFVPLVHALGRAQDLKTLEQRRERLRQAASHKRAWTVIMHPTVPDKEAKVRLRHRSFLAGVGHPPAKPGAPQTDFIRLSPFSLDSVERLARVIRWVTLTPRMLAYPPALNLPRTKIPAEAKAAPWLKVSRNQAWLLQAPGAAELAATGLTHGLEKARRESKSLARDLDRINLDLAHNRGDRRMRSSRMQERRQLRPLMEEARKELALRESLEQALALAASAISALCDCPICPGQGRLTPRKRRCFQVRCGCGAVWELRSDPGSGRRIPVLLPDGKEPRVDGRQHHPSWVDDIYGCDVLSVPVSDANGEPTFALSGRKTRERSGQGARPD